MRLSFAIFPLLVAGACSDDAPPAAADAGAEASAPGPAPTSATDAGPPVGVVYVPVDCPHGTTPESEPNDSPDKANAVADLAFCGSISPGSDVDVSKFETPAGKKLTLFQAVIEGQVDFELTVNGKTLKPGDVKQFEAGAYTVKAFTKDKNPGKYRYRIQVEP